MKKSFPPTSTLNIPTSNVGQQGKFRSQFRPAVSIHPDATCGDGRGRSDAATFKPATFTLRTTSTSSKTIGFSPTANSPGWTRDRKARRDKPSDSAGQKVSSPRRHAATVTGPVIRKEVYITSKDLTSFIVSLGGVKFWAVAIFPMYVGWVLAQPAGGRHLFIDDLRIVLSFVVIGPLL